ncbi:MAG: hypothetical protein KC635_19790 [Myxococcales bacterium]|nr:hypothetical protein [Myxococcales bacterium]MCB9735800.1 hypothetical protein [Deltaproteobacteria bacterium]
MRGMIHVVTGAVALAFGLPGACISSEDAFVDGRLERLCTESIPLCAVRASCTVDEGSYVSSAFPGGQRWLVRSEVDGERARVRLKLTGLGWPGTELVLQAYTPDCAGLDALRLTGDEVARALGDDDVLEHELELGPRGDHLVEIFSDMSAGFLVTIDVR